MLKILKGSGDKSPEKGNEKFIPILNKKQILKYCYSVI